MKYHALRLLSIVALFTFQLIVPFPVFVVLIVGLLTNRFVSPRESYVLVVGSGLLLDLMHFRLFGFSTALVMLVLLKVAERILASKQFEESGIAGLVAASIIGTVIVSLSGAVHGPFVTWIGSLMLSVVLTGMWVVVLYVPLERIGIRYQRVTAS